ncbi:MAG: signal recognition particle-docking protein FtsY [Acidimicrobiia bacterium]
METSLVLAVLALLMIAGVVIWRSRRARRVRAVSPRLDLGELGAGLRGLFRRGLSHSTWDEMEEVLLAADIGVDAAERIVATVRTSRPDTAEDARDVLSEALRSEFPERDRELHLDGAPAVVLVVGVNGTGKTTTIAKLAHRLITGGKRVVLGAADTFRAAAGEQLQVWGKRLGVPVVVGQEGGDPAAVAFDSLASAKAQGADVVLIDTAGRLHGKKNLMEQLAKIYRVAGGERVAEVLLVLDATTGQNGLVQAREFAAAVPVTGIVLTKLDGTAKGGIVLAVEKELGLPVKLVGVGEGIEDLLSFDPDRFVAALLGS